jgi:hypothetical protein
MTWTDNTVITVASATGSLSITGELNASSVNIVKAGNGRMTATNVRAFGLSVNGGTMVVAANSGAPDASTSVVRSLSIAGGETPSAKLDLTNNAAIINYTGTSPAPTIREQILAGRGGAGLGSTWSGLGITSSTAAAANAAEPESRSLGYAENAAMPLGPYSSFHGQPVDDTSILIAYTRTGDANLDGIVNDDDVTIIGATYAPGVSQPSWALGDFDYNGFVDDDDVTLLGALYDPSATPVEALAAGPRASLAAVPEPSALALVTMTAAVFIAARFRRRGTPRD